MSETITSEKDLVKAIRNRFGFVSGSASEHVTVHEKGDSLVHIYSPLEKSQDVIDFLRGMNCRITKKCERTRNNIEVIFEVMIGKSESGDVYARNFLEEEIYTGKPFKKI